jgi:hypothetical protein
MDRDGATTAAADDDAADEGGAEDSDAAAADDDAAGSILYEQDARGRAKGARWNRPIAVSGSSITTVTQSESSMEEGEDPTLLLEPERQRRPPRRTGMQQRNRSCDDDGDEFFMAVMGSAFFGCSRGAAEDRRGACRCFVAACHVVVVSVVSFQAICSLSLSLSSVDI